MKSIVIFISLLVVFQTVRAQNFEGEITYSTAYKSKLPNVADDQFTAMMGTSQKFYIKGGDYKSTMNGTFLQWMLYINKDNKLYTRLASSPAILYQDGNVNTDEVLKAEIKKNATEVLGYKCDELVLTCKSGIQRFFFNSSFRIDDKLFEKHTFGNWSELATRARALPLKYEIENAQFRVQATATSVKSSKLDASFFQLPPDMAIVKSPY